MSHFLMRNEDSLCVLEAGGQVTAEEESCDQVHAGKWFSCCLLLFQQRSIRGTDFR